MATNQEYDNYVHDLETLFYKYRDIFQGLNFKPEKIINMIAKGNNMALQVIFDDHVIFEGNDNQQIETSPAQLIGYINNMDSPLPENYGEVEEPVPSTPSSNGILPPISHTSFNAMFAPIPQTATNSPTEDDFVPPFIVPISSVSSTNQQGTNTTEESEEDEDDPTGEDSDSDDDDTYISPVQPQQQSISDKVKGYLDNPFGTKYEIYTTLSQQDKSKFTQCGMCLYFYNPDHITSYMGEKACYHCLFFINYDVTLRNDVDGIYGTTIADYILKYSESHDETKCTRSESCFLCDFNNKKQIINIIDADKINKLNAPDEGPIEIEIGDDF